jgi:CheY-like chemotaxis protein
VKPITERELLASLRLIWGARKNGRPAGLVTRHTLSDAANWGRAARDAAPRGSLGRILVAGEDESDRRLARAILERLGYQVDVSADGLGTIHAHEENDYDAILLRCTRGEMNGFEATETIRAREADRERRTPIIALVASDSPARESLLAAGIDDVVTKPLRSEELEAALARWTRSAGSAPRVGSRSE